jgi:glycerate dehydrogenase
MKIVVPDGYTAQPWRQSVDELAHLGDLVVRPHAGEVVARAADAEIVLTNKTVLHADAVARRCRGCGSSPSWRLATT